MSPSSFDPLIHAPARLQACAILSSAEEVEFALLRDALDVSDSVLSKHLKQLEEAGYVKARKANSGGRQRTWLALTPAGSKAFRAHVKALEQLAGARLPPSAA